jgi:hypothetical protein
VGTRRANGEGSFTRRTDGCWEGRLRYTDGRGKAHRISSYGATRKAAKQALDDKLDLIQRGLAESTKGQCSDRCRLYIGCGVPADTPLARLTPADFVEWVIAARENKNIADSSLFTDFVVLCDVLDAAVRVGLGRPQRRHTDGPAARGSNRTAAPEPSANLETAETHCWIETLAADP